MRRETDAARPAVTRPVASPPALAGETPVTDQSPIRGGAAVGRLCDIPPLEACAVLYLRLWCDGPAAQRRVYDDFAAALGPVEAQRAVGAIGSLFEFYNQYGRRPLIRHGVDSTSIGVDEACFSNVVAAASEGQHDDAMMIAVLMVRPDVAPILVGLTASFGLALRRLASSPARQVTGAPTHRLH